MKEFRFAFGKITPFILPYLCVGIAFGVLFTEAGYSPWLAAFAAAFIYAGSMQIVLVPLMTSGMSLPLLALMALVVNARHMFYGIGFVEQFRRIGGWRYPYMALTVTDEAYSVLCGLKCPEEYDKDSVAFYVLLICHLMWIIFCTLGALAGGLIPFDTTGIEFCATAFFTTVVVNQWKEFGSKLPALVGLVSAVAFYFIFGPENFMLPALAVSTLALMLLRDRVELKMGGGDDV